MCITYRGRVRRHPGEQKGTRLVAVELRRVGNACDSEDRKEGTRRRSYKHRAKNKAVEIKCNEIFKDSIKN